MPSNNNETIEYLEGKIKNHPRGEPKSNFFEHVEESYDADIANKLNSYSIADIKNLLSTVTENTSKSKRKRRILVAKIVKNQKHAMRHFDDFARWNKDLLQPDVVVYGLGKIVVIFSLMLSLMVAIVAPIPYAVLAFLIILPVFMSFYVHLVTKKQIFVVNSHLVYKSRARKSAEEDKIAEKEANEQRRVEIEQELASLNQPEPA